MPRSRLAFAGLAAVLLVGGPILVTTARAADEIVVRAGETLTSISRRHGVSIDRIVELNEIANPSRIYAGQRLRLEGAPTPPAAAPAEPAAAAPAPRAHTVRSGEHLTGIARHYGVTVAQFVAANGIANASRIYAGQRLTIPGPTAAAPASAVAKPAPAAPRAHTVRSGEHLTGIARHYGVTVAQIVAANGIANASRIYAGQRLTIPGPTATAPASAATGARAMPPSMAALVARRDAVRQVIVEEAGRFGVPEAFALAVAWQESGWQQGVVSHAGAIGVMQLMPTTADWVGEAMLGTTIDPRDLRQNVRGGVRLLAHYLDRYDGDRAKVLAAYYQGQAAVDRHGIYPVSRPYIASIATLEALFARLTGSGLADARSTPQPPSVALGRHRLDGDQVDPQAAMPHGRSGGVGDERRGQPADPPCIDGGCRGAGPVGPASAHLHCHERLGRIQADEVHLAAGACPRAAREDDPSGIGQPVRHGLLGRTPEGMSRIAHVTSSREASQSRSNSSSSMGSKTRSSGSWVPASSCLIGEKLRRCQAHGPSAASASTCRRVP